MAFLKPKTWSEEELARAAARSQEEFATSCRREGIQYYLMAFDSISGRIEEFFDVTDNLIALEDTAPSLFSDGCLDIARYLSSPAISEDDLKNLAGLGSISRSALANEENARAAMDVILLNFDVKRFPWVAENRSPTDEERGAAILATSVMMAGQETQTKRRNRAKAIQEGAVADYLVSMGYAEVPRRSIHTLSDAPAYKEFCMETSVGGKKADVVVGLADGRFMAIECKVSNSEVNSFKRLNHETVEKVAYWNGAFGSNGVIGAAVLAGVFKVENLLAAQDEGVTIFWSFDLSPLGEFIRGAGE